MYQSIEHDLLTIQNPGRYTGGEFRIGEKNLSKVELYSAICFPDLYEIGMSNNAVRILYDRLNRMDEVHCDRVFSVAHDFEALLRERKVDLYTLELKRPLHTLDLLGFSIGFELAAANILQVLDLGNIPLHADERDDEHPIVIAGGPAITNPLPFGAFFDFVYIGEAEGGLEDVARHLVEAKRKGLSRKEKIELLKSFDYLWYPKKERTIRYIDEAFGHHPTVGFEHFVVPNFKVAQDNGVVEIMRGCPNGCRFCHAGQFYKPYRQKELELIKKEVAQYVDELGYREITLSSLSSGDHPQIKTMIEALNDEYRGRNISFSLPSLKVTSFALDILDQLSEVRKSGLTFAIETPLADWQHSMNKPVPLEQVIAIAQEAKARGWRLAKFYFMVGLPFVDAEQENQAIVDYLGAIWDATRLKMNINIGTFIPKAHTPFQWAAQKHPEDAFMQLSSLKRDIQGRIKGAKVSYHEPFISYLEGLVSRGDERFGQIIEAAYHKGCRLDAWDEHLDRQKWQDAIAEADYDPNPSIFTEYSLDEKLGWQSISMKVGSGFLKNELLAAKERILTPACTADCNHLCGVCAKETQVIEAPVIEHISKKEDSETASQPSAVKQAIITYKRDGAPLYVSHISTMRNFEMAFQRSGLEIGFTQGYNPKPKLEFVNPLSIGIKGDQEVLLCEFIVETFTDVATVKDQLQTSIPEGYEILDILLLDLEKKETLAKYMVGSRYEIDCRDDHEAKEQLIALSKKEDPAFTIEQVGEKNFIVLINGERNMVKLLFGKEADKFEVAKRLDIKRTALYAQEMGQTYPEYFESRMA
ncbi:MAG: DUF2344 domain-containing protein [Spirochaetales bacterium]|nr:DUF2344 domain-containing protein [Spirochaetales bacterium]